jgi:hypothetical protein
VSEGRQLVSPVGNGDLRWEELASTDTELAGWCAERWLGPYRRLGPVPPRLTETRVALHRLAEQVISPARRRVNGKIGLRYTRGGFGTPFFGNDVQIPVEGVELVVQAQGTERRAPITSLAAAAEHIGHDAPPDDIALASEPLLVDATASAFLGDWYGFAASVLEELRAEASADAKPSRVQLWPEHFDVAVELGSEATGSARPTVSPPAMSSTPSPTCTSLRGSRRPPARSGRRPVSPAPSFPTPRCSRPQTSARRRSSSSAPAWWRSRWVRALAGTGPQPV